MLINSVATRFQNVKTSLNDNLFYSSIAKLKYLYTLFSNHNCSCVCDSDQLCSFSFTFSKTMMVPKLENECCKYHSYSLILLCLWSNC